jgi:hypothetical protein
MVDAETVVCRGRPRGFAAGRGQGTEGEKPLWERRRAVVLRRERLRKEARVSAQGARVL